MISKKEESRACAVVWPLLRFPESKNWPSCVGLGTLELGVSDARKRVRGHRVGMQALYESVDSHVAVPFIRFHKHHTQGGDYFHRGGEKQLLFDLPTVTASGVRADNVADDAGAIAVTRDSYLFFLFSFFPLIPFDEQIFCS